MSHRSSSRKSSFSTKLVMVTLALCVGLYCARRFPELENITTVFHDSTTAIESTHIPMKVLRAQARRGSSSNSRYHLLYIGGLSSDATKSTLEQLSTLRDMCNEIPLVKPASYSRPSQSIVDITLITPKTPTPEQLHSDYSSSLSYLSAMTIPVVSLPYSTLALTFAPSSRGNTTTAKKLLGTIVLCSASGDVLYSTKDISSLSFESIQALLIQK